MNFPAMPGLTRALAALLIAAAATGDRAGERARGQEADSSRTEHQAVPFVELGQVADKGALRLLPPDSVTRHNIETDSGPIELHRDRRHAVAVRPVGRARRGGVLRRLCRGQRRRRSNGR